LGEKCRGVGGFDEVEGVDDLVFARELVAVGVWLHVTD